MIRSLRLLVIASLFLACAHQKPALDLSAAVQATVPKRYDLRDFFRNPERAYFRLSPDGQYLSFMQPYEKRMNVFVQKLEAGKPTGEPRRLTNETARDIPDYFWKGAEHVLYVKDFGGDENFHVVSVDVNSGDLKDLTPFDKTRADIVDELEDHPTDLLVSHNQRDKTVFDVYRVNTATGEAKLVAKNPGNITGWLSDHEGRVRAATTTDGVNSSVLYRDTEEAEFRTLLTTNFREKLDPILFTFDNKKLYVNSNRGRDKSAICVFDPATAKEESVLFEHPEVDVDNLLYSETRKVLTEAVYTTERMQRKTLDPQTTELYAALEKKLPGYHLILQAHTKDESRWIVAATNDRTEGARYLYDAKSGQLEKLGDVAPWRAESDMAPMQPVTFAARDGLTLHGYLTLPLGRGAKGLPLIVNPHGGPWARDGWNFNSEVQFLANRGYAILQVNFRGSTGYGRKFWEASFKQWGKTMQDDLTDGVNWLVQQGIVDPKRVAIYGGSYGGYATLAGVAFSPDVYACGVDYVGVSNLLTFMNTIPPYWEPMRQMLYEMVGNPEKERALLEAASPVFHAEKIKAALFVAQGANDPRVNKAESDQIVESLRKRNVPVEYMVKDNEGHGFDNEENRFDFYAAMEKFLEKHLGAK